jgi:hypothetical protein
MAKSQPSDFELPLKSGTVQKGFIGPLRVSTSPRVMICVSVVTGLVLPPLYLSSKPVCLPPLTGEIDQFTLRYYEDLFRELQLDPFNTLLFHRQRFIATCSAARSRIVVRMTTAARVGLLHRVRSARLLFSTPSVGCCCSQGRTCQLLAQVVARSDQLVVNVIPCSA